LRPGMELQERLRATLKSVGLFLTINLGRLPCDLGNMGAWT